MPDKNNHAFDQRIPLYIEAAERLKRGEFDFDVPAQPDDEIGQLGLALQELAQTLERRYRELRRLDRITSHINAGLLLDEILENVFEDFRELIPYHRIGFALLEDEGRIVRARWAKSDYDDIRLGRGYSARMSGSSLEKIIQTGQPRILNDLREYLRQNPGSESTRLILEEGILSSLTCPLIANGVPVGFIFFSSTQSGTYDDVHVDVFQRIAGQLSLIVEKGRLVSELAEQKNAIERQNRELMRLNEVKNTFVGVAAHDLRNPVAMIQMGIDFMLDTRLAITPEEREGILVDMGKQAQHMLNLLNDLLDVTQIESGRLELRVESINIPDFLSETVIRHAQLASTKGTHVKLDVTTPNGTVQADPFRLRQVMDNLISNAVKYSPAGSTVYVAARQTTPGWRFSVTDEGPGITPQDRQRLFEKFARLSARPTGGEKSTGLGLAIARRIVEAHGGQIDVDSVPGQGATFWFTLPSTE